MDLSREKIYKYRGRPLWTREQPLFRRGVLIFRMAATPAPAQKFHVTEGPPAQLPLKPLGGV